MNRAGRPVTELPAIIQVPSIGLVAPVQQGLSDAVLNVSVGHDAVTVWPGSFGTSILLAHDASYFSNLGGIHVGDTVSWIDDCRRLYFKVDKIEIVTPGTALPPQPSGRGLALITCYPADALFWTTDRLVVLANYVGQRSSWTHVTHVPPPLGILLPPLPAGLAQADLGLPANHLLVGTWSVTGNPTRTWAEGADPLRVVQLAFRGLAAAVQTVNANQTSWWKALAVPGATMPASIPTGSQFSAIITVNGVHVTAVALSSPLATVEFVVKGGKLYVAAVTLPS